MPRFLGEAVLIVVNSPMNILIAFCTHLSFLRMMTGVCNVAIRPTSIAGFQWFNTVNLRQISCILMAKRMSNNWLIYPTILLRDGKSSRFVLCGMGESKWAMISQLLSVFVLMAIAKSLSSCICLDRCFSQELRELFYWANSTYDSQSQLIA